MNPEKNIISKIKDYFLQVGLQDEVLKLYNKYQLLLLHHCGKNLLEDLHWKQVREEMLS